MTKTELRSLVEEYLKRSDFSPTVFDFWVRATLLRLGQQWRGQDNLIELVLAPVANPVLLPPDYRAMRSVEWSGTNSTYRVRSMEAGINQLMLAGGSAGPVGYRVNGFLLELRPFFAVPLTVRYWREPPALPLDSSTSVELDAQPQLFLYGCLIEGAIWAQDVAGAQGYVSVFDSQVETLNDQARSANAGDTPAMMGEG
jgi:hypothetical protein